MQSKTPSARFPSGWEIDALGQQHVEGDFVDDVEVSTMKFHLTHSISRAFDSAEATNPAGTDTIPRPTSNTKNVNILPPTVTG